MSRQHKRANNTVEEPEEDSRATGVGEPESSMMAMVRALMEDNRRADLAREEARLDREAENARRLAEQQAATEARQFEQQIALLKIQAEMGEKASRAHREYQSSDRKRDRALYSIPVLKEGEDVEEFLMTAERRLTAAEVKKEEWIPVIDSRLGGKIASAWQDITITTGDYQEARDRLLKICGYTPRLAADCFFGYRVEHSKGLTADQLYHHREQQLLRRMIAPGRLNDDIEFAILRGWVGTVISKRARAAVEARVVTDAPGLISALQDFLVLDGDRSEGQTATFRRGSGEVSKERSTSLTCFKCGKVGHKAIDCWKGGASVPKGGASRSGGVASKVVCYTCGEEGHKSPQCPKQWKKDGPGKDARPKPVKRVWRSQPKCVQLLGVVNGQNTPILLDSGAAISVVPESLVTSDRLTGSRVAVKSFAAKESMLLPTAIVPFKIGELEWEERVAVAPRQEGAEEEVLYSLDLQSDRGLKLVLLVNKIDQTEVLRVTTRAQTQKQIQEEEEEVVAAAQEEPRAKPLSRGVIR